MEAKSFKLMYTELIGNEEERDGEMVIETKDINWTIEQFMRNRHVIKIKAKEMLNKMFGEKLANYLCEYRN